MDTHVRLALIALITATIGGLFIGAVAWLSQGEVRGTGDVFGMGILAPLGIIFILFGLGTALASSVTYLVQRQ